jgi:hypothetical protein
LFCFRSIIGRDLQGFKKNILAFVYRMPLVSLLIFWGMSYTHSHVVHYMYIYDFVCLENSWNVCMWPTSLICNYYQTKNKEISSDYNP